MPAADRNPHAPRLLVLRALNLGDLLVAVPALRALRRQHPDHHTVLAANGRFAPLVRLTGAVDELLPHRGLDPPALQRPDVAVDLHGVLPHSVRALQGTRPRRLVAFAAPEVGHLDGPAVDQTEHEVDRWCRLVAWSGAEPDRDDLLLPSPGQHARATTIVHTGAAYASKWWPESRFAAVAAALAADGHDVVLTGSTSERPRALRVAHGAGLPASTVLAGATSLDELLSLVAHARLVVTGDTGVAHLATAFARPSVVLFGPASPRLWGPPARRWHAALWHGTEEREVLTDVPDAELLKISVEEVLTAVTEVLAAAPPGSVRR